MILLVFINASAMRLLFGTKFYDMASRITFEFISCLLRLIELLSKFVFLNLLQLMMKWKRLCNTSKEPPTSSLIKHMREKLGLYIF